MNFYEAAYWSLLPLSILIILLLLILFFSTPKTPGRDLDSTMTSQSTNLTIPLDYETDELRKELTAFGEPPGPITKTTKKLYIKKLIKYKRKTPKLLNPKENVISKYFSFVFYFLGFVLLTEVFIYGDSFAWSNQILLFLIVCCYRSKASVVNLVCI